MPVFHLAPHRASHELIACLQALLDRARSGTNPVVGIAFVAMVNHREYFVDIAGETRRSPTFTRGMLHLLDDQLARLIDPRN